jgi:hypothetical protein
MKRLALALLLLVALAAGGALWLRARGPDLPPPPSQARLETLRAERDSLEATFRALVVARGEKSLATAPKAGLMIGIPTTMTSAIVEQIVTGLFGETTLTLRNLKVKKAGEVKAKMLFRKKRVGVYDLDVRIHEVQGLLRPGRPALSFATNEVGLKMPVQLAEGGGNAELRFKWDSKGLAANTVCGDVDVTRTVSGGVVPNEYQVSGSFVIAAAGGTITLAPRFPDLAVRIFVDPSEQAWGVVEAVVKDQRKGCEIALNKIDIKEKLSGILGRGFNVKIPQKIFKPIKLPAGVKQSLEVQGISLALHVKPTGLVVAGDRLWYGADLDVSAAPPRRSRVASR